MAEQVKNKRQRMLAGEQRRRMVTALSHMDAYCEGLMQLDVGKAASACSPEEVDAWVEKARWIARQLPNFAEKLNRAANNQSDIEPAQASVPTGQDDAGDLGWIDNEALTQGRYRTQDRENSTEVGGDDGLPLVDGLPYTSWARFRLRTFCETKNPVWAWSLIYHAHRAGVAPHEIVLKWLGECAEKYFANECKTSMDRIMKLRGGRGGAPAYKALLLSTRNALSLENMAKLRVQFGLKIEDAAELVAALLETTPWNETGWKVKNLDAATLQEKYKGWAARRNVEQIFKEHTPSEDEIKTYVSLFPYERLRAVAPPFAMFHKQRKR